MAQIEISELLLGLALAGVLLLAVALYDHFVGKKMNRKMLADDSAGENDDTAR